MNYVEIDPVISAGIRGFLPIDWSSIPKEGRSERHFFGEAQDFGISANGMTIPVRGAKGEIALLSINSSLSAADWSEYKKRNVADISFFAHLFHHQVLRGVGKGENGNKVRLTPRERQVLVWASLGKTCWETARIMGLSQRTIDFYVRNAAVKLNAVTKTQAVATAIAENYIVVDVLSTPED